jgi:hypothetical protein
MITEWGKVSHIPQAVIAAADEIKHLNYKTTNPSKFRKATLTEEMAGEMMQEISQRIGVDPSALDYVYFSACKGAQPHTDDLDPAKFTSRTFVVPVILPAGNTVIIAEEVSAKAQLGHIYEFNHEKIHSMTVEDPDSGCVVIMIAIKH